MNSKSMPLSGIVVIDESQGPAAGLATMVLADFGADVIKVEPPGGDVFREMPSSRLWLRGKRSVVLDRAHADHRDTMLRLAAHADVWVRGPFVLAVAPGTLSDDELMKANARLVLAWVSAFGRNGPWANIPPYEALVAAKVGRMLQFRGLPSRPGPAYCALQVATHAASQSLLAGVLAALHAVTRDDVGQMLETSMARGLLAYDMGGLLLPQVNAWHRSRGEPEIPPMPDPAAALPTLNYHPVRTSDGRWLQLGNLLPHLFMNFVRAVGLETEYDALDVSGPTALWPEDKREAFRDVILTRMQQKTLDEWQRIFINDGGVASHPYQSTEQALADDDVLANGHSVPMGSDGRQLGLLANLTRTPGAAGGPAPRLGEHTEQVLSQVLALTKLAAQRVAPSAVSSAAPPTVASQAAPRPTATSARKAPLDGITVVEAATIIAAPFGAALLADLGARVIKLEPPEGDPFRNMAPGLGAARVNSGKESIALDLKQARAQRVAQQLVAKADIFIHNYRPGVPERLGLGYEQLAALNPKLVYLSANGYGPAGPGALRPSTHPIPGAAMGGVLHQIGGEPQAGAMSLAQLRETARRLMRANDVNPDPNTSLVICSVALLGLSSRRRLGVGQSIFVDMFGANAYANFDDALSFPGKTPRQSPDREGLGLHPLWRLYRCARGWVFLAVASDDEWQRLRAALGGAGSIDAAVFVADFDRARNGGDALAAAVQAVFASKDAAHWEAVLSSQGIGCVQADAALPEAFFLNDPIADREQLLVTANHKDWGPYRRHGALVVLHGTPGIYRGAALNGEHTDALLRELGLSVDYLRQT